MNTKIEPVLVDVRDNNVSSPIDTESPKDISQLINFVKKQTELNQEVISALTSTELTKKEQLEMIQLLSDGAEKSSMFIKLLKNNEQEIGIEINDSIPSKGKINDKFNKFKNIIVSAKANIDSSMVFRNPLKPDWYEVGHKIGLSYKIVSSKGKSIRETLDSFISQSSNKLGIVANKVQSVSNFFQSQFILIGEKKNVKVLEKNFTQLFDLLGINAKEILHSSEFTNNLSEEELNNRIYTKLKKDVNALKDTTENKFTFPILNGLTPELQLSMAQTILWPKLNTAIKESMEVNQTLQSSQTDNKYLKMVSDFAEENKFHPDLVLHSLKNNPELLSDYPKSNILLANTSEILENSDKYGKFVINNLIYLESLVKASDDLHNIVKELKVSQDLKGSFNTVINDSIVFTNSESVITFGQLKNNLLSVKVEEKTYSPKTNKNGA